MVNDSKRFAFRPIFVVFVLTCVCMRICLNTDLSWNSI